MLIAYLSSAGVDAFSFQTLQANGTFRFTGVKVSGDLHPDSAKALGEKVKATIRAKVEHPLWQGGQRVESDRAFSDYARDALPHLAMSECHRVIQMQLPLGCGSFPGVIPYRERRHYIAA